MRKLISALCLGASFMLPVTALALTANQTVQKVVEVKNPDGTVQVKYVDADMVSPGEKIVYTLIIENDGAAVATDLVLIMPVPSEVKFVEGSATNSGTIVSYSADGGQTYSARNGLMALNSDGSVRVAETEDITHIQWKITDPIQSGNRDSLSFQGVLK